MDYITALVQHFLSIPVEKFTDKLISAIQIAKVGNFKQSEYNKIINIETNTNDTLMISFYKLDRQINPEKTGFKRQSNYAVFFQNKPKDANGDRPELRLSEREIQDHLCVAIRKVTEIVMNNTKDYNMQFKLPSMNQGSNTGINF